jgi:hypothetical protein
LSNDHAGRRQSQPRVIAGQVGLQLFGQADPVEQEVHDRQAAQPLAAQRERICERIRGQLRWRHPVLLDGPPDIGQHIY